jgi:hypothetical protein
MAVEKLHWHPAAKEHSTRLTAFDQCFVANGQGADTDVLRMKRNLYTSPRPPLGLEDVRHPLWTLLE